ncbi:MAG: DeoR/GlpR family DNA-binding transcription regulator [Bacteroidales bacterium]|nr:DeoR/GlpR family DNA-binding transcription regulator [Bacteroidales bacterium]
MINEQRRKKILQFLRKEGTLRVEALAARLGVSGATIRSDLRELEKEQVVRRSHGLVSPSILNVTDLPVAEKYNIRREEKERIGLLAASLICEGDSLLVTSGTTAEALARVFPDGQILNVVTSSIRVASILSAKKDIRIVVLGGTLVSNSLSVRDDYSLMGLDNIHAGKLFFSCDGFDLGAGITTAFPEEARLTCRMMSCADEIILLADSSKLGRIGFGRIAGWEELDTLITDSEIPTAVRSSIESLGVRVLIA